MRVTLKVGRWVAVVVLVASMLVIGSSVRLLSSEDGAVAWARGLSSEQRVAWTQTGTFEHLPYLYRRALFSSLPTPQERASVWRSVFEGFKAARTFSAAQQVAYDQAVALVTADVMRGRRTPEQDAAMKAARTAIEQTMGMDAARYLYSRLGPGDDLAARLPVMERVLLSLRLTAERSPIFRPLSAGEPGDPTCNCAVDGDCSGHQKCKSPFHCVERTPWWGCGENNLCVKLCSFDTEE